MENKFSSFLIAMFVTSLQLVNSANAGTIKDVCYIKPCQIKGDFDGDGKIDRAVLVQDKIGNKGIEIRFANRKTVLIGAGEVIGNGGLNFDWMDHWELYRGKIVPGPTETEKIKSIKGDALYLAKTNSASGVVYWDGSQFHWIQQGD